MVLWNGNLLDLTTYLPDSSNIFGYNSVFFAISGGETRSRKNRSSGTTPARPTELLPPTLHSMSTHSIKCLLTATLFSAACALSSTALAEDLTIYSNIVKPVDAHTDEKDFGVGHRRIRETEVRLSKDGKVAGKSYSISSVVDVDSRAGTGTRVALRVTELPKGTIWTETTVTDIPHKSSVKLGHQHTGIILGGTRAYAGVTGTYDLEFRKDGKHAVTVFHIVRGKK